MSAAESWDPAAQLARGRPNPLIPAAEVEGAPSLVTVPPAKNDLLPVEEITPTDQSLSSAAGAASASPSDSAVAAVERPMLSQVSPRPRAGWRALAYDITSGRWNPGPSVHELKVRERESLIARRLDRRHVTAFFCLKGGISKTSTTAATSLALSDLRPDPVFAIDANPDAGDLAERLVGESHAGISALARDIDSIHSLEALSKYTVTTGRLTMLPGEPNPVLGDSLRAQDFKRILDVVGTYYSLVQVDCGTGVTHPLMSGILEHTDTAVIPAAWSITGARRAAETIAWLRANGFTRLAGSSIVVLTAKDLVSGQVDRGAVLHHLRKAADLIVVPADPHVADGAQLSWEKLQRPTQEAYLDIAAAITSRFMA
ncbi:MinD/ParA family ATP-binding protein [Dermatophilus congolensis]|uniref:Flp pilus assembly protein, ATPase CpaE n=1 Tax=Dermatophilus congolensis TaxID=1863 RepID=A0A239V3R6_9MICO|nr:hypothetical protein [Dermatophilus congolensis]SNV16891.1 Flp pilus assembly protein, ATPase CpaE [Dermatophilus congolensis]